MKFGKLAIVNVSWSVFAAVDDSDLDFQHQSIIDVSRQGSIWSKWDIENGLTRSQKAIDKHIEKARSNGCTHVLFIGGKK